VGTVTSSARVVAEVTAAFEAEDFERCHEVAVDALLTDPDNVALLQLAGRASLELGLEDAVPLLQARAARAPKDADAWLDLGHAHAASGNAGYAADAFTQAVALTPEEPETLLHLAYAAHAVGRIDDALAALDKASTLAGEKPEILRSLVGLAHATGRLPLALSAATRLTAADPKDVQAALDVAEISLETGDNDGAAAAFARLRGLDDGHETFAAHGEVEALVRGGRWRDALDTAIAATALDRHNLTTDLLAFVSVKLFGSAGGERHEPDWPLVEEQLRAERVTHRRLHAEGSD
jgi:tetratricopeptide (TPR) repeat protein